MNVNTVLLRLSASGLRTVVCLLWLFGGAMASAQTVPLAWDPVADPSVAGYVVYVGTQSGTYSETHDAGNRTSFSYVLGRTGPTYYFAVAAYSSSGAIGPRSAELRWTGAGPLAPSAATATDPASPTDSSRSKNSDTALT